MTHIYIRLLRAGLILMLFLSSCSQANLPSATATHTPSAIPPTPTATKTMRSATPIPTTIPPTQTPSPAPISTQLPEPDWLVDAQSIPDWPEDANMGASYWKDSFTLDLKRNFDFPYELSFADGANQPPFWLPTPSIFQEADYREINISPKGTYFVVCSEPSGMGYDTIYKTLTVYRYADQKRISQVQGIETPCQFAIRWARDESVLSFTSKIPSSTEGLPIVDIYAWKPDGTQPRRIGQGTDALEGGRWSADATRLVVEYTNFNAPTVDEMYTYKILSLTGQPEILAKALLSSRALPGLSWLTDKIVYETSSCCGTCAFREYYLADTGENLPDMAWMNCSPLTVNAQGPALSPDQKYIVIDQTNAWFDSTDLPLSFHYTLFNLDTRQSTILSNSSEWFLDFVGWDQGSRNFFFVRRPINDEIQPDPNAPPGLFALDPATLRQTLIAPEVRFAWLNPQSSYFFTIEDTTDQFSGSVRDLAGKKVTQGIQLHMPEKITQELDGNLLLAWYVPDSMEPVEIAWAHSGERVILRTWTGDLWMLTADHQPQNLGSNLPDTDYSFGDTNWSPDDSIFLYATKTKGWAIWLPAEQP